MHAVPKKVAEKPLQTARRRLRKRDRVYTRNDDAGDVAHMDRGVSGNPFTLWNRDRLSLRVGTRMHAAPKKAARMPLGTARRRLRKGIAFIRATSTPETSHACREVPGSPYTF